MSTEGPEQNPHKRHRRQGRAAHSRPAAQDTRHTHRHPNRFAFSARSASLVSHEAPTRPQEMAAPALEPAAASADHKTSADYYFNSYAHFGIHEVRYYVSSR